MSSPIIKVEGISKKYNLLHKDGGTSDSLIESASRWARSLVSREKSHETREEFWALRDISFEIQPGDRVGIIGRNGAGKSTLLKILSRIVLPTSGRIEYDGRMASLLEVGTGFHGDLSGRENIYLNGSILGMSKKEIDRKFDEIIDFAEVEKFLDTPVKRYSSGMYVRLAFAVAAHLEPEILIVDEVLAVGDAAFQKKCLGKMREVSGSGRTILFVSHNMAAIQNLCDKCVYLKNGQLVDYGKSELIIPQYLQSTHATSGVDLSNRPDRMGNGKLRYRSFQILDKNKQVTEHAMCGSPLYIDLDVEGASDANLSYVRFSVAFDDDYGNRITHMGNDITNQLFEKLPAGPNKIRISIPKLPLKGGEYTVTLFAEVNGEVADWIQEATLLQVESGDFYNLSLIHI